MKGYTLKTVFCLSLFVFFVLPFANPVLAQQKENDAVFAAIRSQDPMALEKALKKVYSVNFVNRQNNTPLIELLFSAPNYSSSKVMEMVVMLVQKGSNLNRTDGASALTAAAHISSTELLEYLFRNGASVKYGFPLHRACLFRNTIAMNLYLQKGADPNTRSDYGKTPAQVMLMSKHSFNNTDAMLIILENAGANLHVRNEANETLLDMALRIDDRRAVNYLRSRDVEQTIVISYPELDENFESSLNFSRTFYTQSKDKGLIFGVSDGQSITVTDLETYEIVMKADVTKNEYTKFEGMYAIYFEVIDSDGNSTYYYLVENPNLGSVSGYNMLVGSGSVGFEYFYADW